MDKFETIHKRTNTRSIKWDALQDVFATDDVLPMWVADMDFQAPQAVNDAIKQRAEHGIYGYTVIDHDVKNAIVQWVKRRHQWNINHESLSFSPGVVTSLHMAIQAFTQKGDKILIQTPVYTPFYHAIKSHERIVVTNPLIYENDAYHIDIVHFEEQLKLGVKAFILCSPHNPVGRVWTKEELAKMARLCLKYNVLIIADEIHADLVYPGFRHIPIASLSQQVSMQTITCMSPSKTFNLAGLQASYIITENNDMKKQLDTYFDNQGLGLLNTMGNIALEAAYLHGEKWLDNLIHVLEKHRQYVIHSLESQTDLKVIRPQGTYLLWIDCHTLQLATKDLSKFMIEKAKIGLNSGLHYGKEGGQFMRMNIACPKATLEEGVQRLIHAINNR